MTTSRERLDVLLVDEATHGLTDSARVELEILLEKHKDVDRYAFERAAAAVFLAVAGASGDLPAALGSKLAADAATKFLSDVTGESVKDAG